MVKINNLAMAFGYANSTMTNQAELIQYNLDVDFPSAGEASLNERPFLDMLSSPVGEGTTAGAWPPYSFITCNIKNNNTADLIGGDDFDRVTIKLPARRWVQDSFVTADVISLTERDFGLDNITNAIKLYKDRPNIFGFEIPNLQYYRIGAASPSMVNKNNSTVYLSVDKVN